MISVIAVSAVAAIAIVAWLIREVARRAIDKTAPDHVAPVLLALAALASPFRWFLPWSSQSGIQDPAGSPLGAGQLTRSRLHNKISADLQEESGHEK